MKPKKRRPKCLNCSELFRPDARNLERQRYCGKPECRKASKKAAQARWLAKPENATHFRDARNVTRVQEWRKAHPGYSKAQAARRARTLKERSLAQIVEHTDVATD